MSFGGANWRGSNHHRAEPRRFAAKADRPIRDVSAALDYVLRWLASDHSGIDEIRSLGDIHAAGHRAVHGGELFKESVIINDELLKGIEDCIDLAPFHNPNNLRGIRALREILGQATPQVAVFDTAFHTSIPEHAYLYALPTISTVSGLHRGGSK